MAQKYTVELELKYKEAVKDLDEFQKEYAKLEKEVQGQNKATADSIKNIEGSSKSAAKGIKAIGASIKAIGIGLLIAAFAKLKEVFEENQKVADFFNVTFEALSLAFNDFFNFLDRNVGNVVGYFKAIFSDPVQAIKDFGNAIVDNVIERVKSSLEVLGLLGSAIKKVFSGDFTGALEDAKSAGKELVDVVTGVDDSFNKISDAVSDVVDATSNYVGETIKAAKATVELNKQAEIAAVLQQGIVESFDRQAEKLRQVRDEERNTIADRIKANNDLKAVLDEQEAAMLKQVDTIIAAAQAQYNKNVNQENYIALLEATQEREAVLAQIEGFRSEQKSNDLALFREEIELNNSLRDSDFERQIANEEFNASLIENDVARIQRLKDIAQLESDIREEQLRDDLARTKLGTQAQVDAQNALFDFLQDNAQKQIQLDRDLLVAKTQLTQSQADASAKRAISEQQFLAEQIEGEYLRLEALKNAANQEVIIEEERLTNKRNQYKEGTQAFVDANNELLAFQQQNAQEQIKIDRDLNLAKQQLVTDALGNLASIVGENSKFGKGIALVQAIRDTYAGANLALASAPPPFNFVSAAAVIAGGLANVKAITATKEPTPPSFARGAGGGEASVSVPTPSSFATGVKGGGASVSVPPPPSFDREAKGDKASVSVPPPPSFTRETKGDGASVLVPTLPSFATRVGGGSVSAPIPSTPPSFNVVGTSGTNQLADVIAGQSKQPIKAYVVSSDVSTAQSLDRNIIEGASI